MAQHGYIPQSIRILTVPILLVISSLTLPAQDKSPVPDSANEAVAGAVRVKVSRTMFKEEIEPSFFANLVGRYGIVEVTPWLNRDLLRYIERRSGMYKRNGSFGDGLGGWARETREHQLMRIVVVKYTADASPEEVAAALSAFPGVEYAEPIWKHSLLFSPNDPRVRDGEQWHLETIKALAAWDRLRGDSSMVIAITDTGIERNHPDLKNAIWYNPGETGNGRESNKIDDDENGYVDDWWGYDFAGADGESPENDPSPGANDHGVHVAGIAGASGDNDIGGAGVAFGAKLMAVKISDDRDTPELPGGFEGILYAAAMEADVINCSWGALKGSTAEQEVIDLVVLGMGIPIVAAAGNDGLEKIRYPAGYRNVLSVAATTAGDGKLSMSNYHYFIDICAPGGSIYSTLDGGQYGKISGTSMASPMVAAAAALLRKHDPSLAPAQIYEILENTADYIDLSLGLQYRGRMGSGRLNLDRALESGASIRSARMTSYVVEEGTPDGIIEPGEELTIRATIHNLLAPADNVEVNVAPVEPITLQIDGASFSLGPMASGATATTPPGSIRFTVPETAVPDSRIVVSVTTSVPDSQSRSNVEHVLLNVFPTYATTDLNKIAATFNSVGNVGYNGMNREQGDGFFYEQEGSLLWHGGLMIGTAQDRLVDVVRRGESAEGTNDGFRMVDPYRLRQEQGGQLEIGSTTFTDRRGVLGLDVEMTSYEFAQDSNFVIVAYKVTNTGDSPLDNLHCGLYLDWDLQTDGKGDQASYDEANRLGFVRNRNNTDLLIGTALLSDQTPLYYAVDNLALNITSQQNFTNAVKWTMLSSGITRQNTPPNVDVSMVIGGGPVRIEAGASETFVFGMMAATSFAELQETTQRAKARHLLISDVPEPGPVATHVTMQAVPNPFSDETVVSVRMPYASEVRLEFFDLHGRSVGLLHDGRLEEGEHTFRFDSGNLPSGVYFYRLRGESAIGEGQVVLVR